MSIELREGVNSVSPVSVKVVVWDCVEGFAIIKVNTAYFLCPI